MKNRKTTPPPSKKNPFHWPDFSLTPFEHCLSRLTMNQQSMILIESSLEIQRVKKCADLERLVCTSGRIIPKQEEEKHKNTSLIFTDDQRLAEFTSRLELKQAASLDDNIILLEKAKQQMRRSSLSRAKVDFTDLLECIIVFLHFLNPDISPKTDIQDLKKATKMSRSKLCKLILQIIKADHFKELPSFTAFFNDDLMDEANEYRTYGRLPVLVAFSSNNEICFLEPITPSFENEYTMKMLNSYIQATIQLAAAVGKYVARNSTENSLLEDKINRYTTDLINREEYENFKSAMAPLFEKRGWFSDPAHEIEGLENYCFALEQCGEIDQACAILDESVSEANSTKAQAIKQILRGNHEEAFAILCASDLSMNDFVLSRFFVRLLPMEDLERVGRFITPIGKDHLSKDAYQ